MKCEICGNEFRAVGVHVAKTHGMTSAEYRRMHGMKATKPLVDGDLSTRYARAARRRVANLDYRLKLIEQCRANNAARSTP
jgi:predicted transcriptional regulator